VYEHAGVPGGVEIVSVEFSLPPVERLTLVGFRPMISPEGELEAVNVTVPGPPTRLEMAIVEELGVPCVRFRLFAFEEMEKSGLGPTVTERIVVWNQDPIVPLIVTEYVPVAVDIEVETVIEEFTVRLFESKTVFGLRPT